MAAKTYILHTTIEYVVKQKETGETEACTSRPTLSIKAETEEAAIAAAKAQEKARLSTDWWPVVSLSLSVGHVTVVDS